MVKTPGKYTYYEWMTSLWRQLLYLETLLGIKRQVLLNLDLLLLQWVISYDPRVLFKFSTLSHVLNQSRAFDCCHSRHIWINSRFWIGARFWEILTRNLSHMASKTACRCASNHNQWVHFSPSKNHNRQTYQK